MTKKLILIFFLLFISLPVLAQVGSLLLSTNPRVREADVYLNGSRIGRLDNEGKLYRENIRVGTYRLVIRQRGYAELVRQITIEEGLTAVIENVSLERIDEGTDRILATASLYIDCNVGDADVFLDGDRKGKTSFEGRFIINNVSLGKHLIQISKKGYTTHKKEISISARQQGLSLPVKAQLKEKPKTGFDTLIIFIVILVTLVVIILVITIFKVIRSFRLIRGRFDSYLVQEFLARGGMSTVYKATDINDKKTVALKVMDDRFLQDKDLINKFQKEGEGLYLINQKFVNVPIVKVFRYGRENSNPYGRPFIAMEYLKGPSLFDLISSKKRYSSTYTTNLIKQVASALAAAHSLKIYHRDVTPDNIIITRNNPHYPSIKLIDFGIAKHEYTEKGTLDGTISGKPPYMSPEQCRGAKVDGRSDIYSLGIIFYTMVVGYPPFTSRNPLEVMYAHENKPVPPLPNNIPEAIRKIVSKMLQKNRLKRYQSMNELIDDLDKLRI
jgi:tRNA A-37 threonylcarbamoyl transferase component Bud32